MKNHESVSEYKIPELAMEGEVYDELQREKELDKISEELEAKARAAEEAGENAPEKAWTEHMAEVDEFDKEKAEEAVEKDAPTVEEAEKGTTRRYEAEIMALNKFAETADFLDESIETPTETDLVRRWEENDTLHMHSKEVQDWLHKKELSVVDEEYRKELLKSGKVSVEKKLFYKPDETVMELWKKNKEAYARLDRQEKIREFAKEQDEIERRLEDEVRKYEPNRDGFIKYNHGRAEDMPMPSKLELVYNWVENDAETSLERADMILDWLESDDGSDDEKRYRALVITKLSGKFRRLEAGYNNEKLEERPVRCMTIYDLSYNKERNKFLDKLRAGDKSADYAELTSEEKEERWREAEEKYREGIIRRNEMREGRSEHGRKAEKPKETPKETLRDAVERKVAEQQKEDEEWRERLLNDSSLNTGDSSSYFDPFGFPMAG
ncbi:hypothetical protein IKG20_02970 [Candidatus Saccharibacteria bacterium]|nr:hypothetical protein [Candidatus Saccharibacteria bacterium]